jgi:RND family efflux transporter MFP subunit
MSAWCAKAICLAAATVLLAACGRDNQYVAPPPPKVTVAKPIRQQVTRYLEATGNTVAVNSTDLIARVPGFLQEVSYEDGAFVKKDANLFTIEPEPYKVKLEQAQAAEAGAQASVKQMDAEYDRQSDLEKRQVSSKAALDTATANRDSARAKLQQSQGDTEQAKINLDYTQVKAPFDGIVGARQVSIGQYVGSTPTVLATIVQVDPIYVNFNVSERDVLRIREGMAKRGITREDLRNIPVEIGLQNETGYPHRGQLDYAAPSVSQSTGTLLVRGVFENKDRTLVPGYFVRVRVPGPTQGDASLLVPDVAVGADQGGRYVLVVNQDNVVEQRKVEVGQRVDALRVIEKGLTPDDRVVVAGILRAIPGQKVDPQTQAASTASQ